MYSPRQDVSHASVRLTTPGSPNTIGPAILYHQPVLVTVYTPADEIIGETEGYLSLSILFERDQPGISKAVLPANDALVPYLMDFLKTRCWVATDLGDTHHEWIVDAAQLKAARQGDTCHLELREKAERQPLMIEWA